MRIWAFMRELEGPEWRPRLRAGIGSGYAVAFAFAGLAYAAGRSGIMPHVGGIYAVVAFKLLTNTIAWGALSVDRGVFWTQTLNTNADLLAMTGGIYLTGGPLSPLLAVYVIVISVLGLLGTTGITLLAATIAFSLHAAMTALIYFDVLPFIPPPMSDATALDGPQTLVAVLYAGIVLGVTGVVTSRLAEHLRQKTERLRVRTDELLAAGEARSLLLANVTHELRTPLHGILGTLELFDTGIYGDVDDKGVRAHEQIGHAAQTLGLRIDDLLSLSRAEAGKLEVKRAPVDTEELLASVAGQLRWMLETKNIELIIECEPALGTICTDRGKLSQILLNLLVNAVKFTDEGGRVTLSAERRGAKTVLCVQDTGMGMAPEQLETIFEAFYQVDEGDERSHGGVGLGLTIVQHMLELLGGEVEVESRLEEGSTFRVLLPTNAELTSDER